MSTETASTRALADAVSRTTGADEGGTAPFVPQPLTVEETGLDFSMILDLVVKAIYFAGRPAARQIAAQIALPFAVIDEILAFMKREQMAEVVGSSGMGEQLYQYSLSTKGMEKAEEALARNHYIGPAPVPFDLYLEVLKAQSIKNIRLTPVTVERSVSHLVLDDSVIEALGPAVNSGRSMLIYGGSGNGSGVAGVPSERRALAPLVRRPERLLFDRRQPAADVARRRLGRPGPHVGPDGWRRPHSAGLHARAHQRRAD